MKKNICLYFQIHQSAVLRTYRFFDIGTDSHYFDDFTNRSNMLSNVKDTMLPMNELLLDLIKENKGAFKIAISITGTTIELLQRYAPEVIDGLKALVDTKCVEIVATPYSHSLSSLASETAFRHQVAQEMSIIQETFGVKPTTLANAELVYSDAIGAVAQSMGFKAMITEGAKNVLGWRSANHVYCADSAPKLKLFLRNYSLSDDIATRFSKREWASWPLTADKYAGWLSECDGDVVTLGMDYAAFGGTNRAESGIFEFLKALPEQVLSRGMAFSTPAGVARRVKAVDSLPVPDAISWIGYESGVTAWLSNELQQEAYNKLYALTEKLSLLDDEELWSTFGRLQEMDYLYYMNTKFFEGGDYHRSFNNYNTPYDAFINFMNALNDFSIRVDNKIAEQ